MCSKAWPQLVQHYEGDRADRRRQHDVRRCVLQLRGDGLEPGLDQLVAENDHALARRIESVLHAAFRRDERQGRLPLHLFLDDGCEDLQHLLALHVFLHLVELRSLGLVIAHLQPFGGRHSAKTRMCGSPGA
jgi:hypothetical protein